MSSAVAERRPVRLRVAHVRRAPTSLVLVMVLCIANAIALPSFLDPTYWPTMLAQLAPLALVAMASTPSFLARGLDLSISPLLVVVNIVIVRFLMPHDVIGGVLLIPIALTIGGAIGLLIGAAIAVMRVPSVLVTLAALFILSGVAQSLLDAPIPLGPSWLDHLAGSMGPVPGGLVMIAVPLLAWKLLERSSFGVNLRAVGDADATALSAGIDVTRVRLIAYASGGVLAGVGALSFTALVRSADSSNPTQFTLVALAAVALGGTAMTGGRGGLGLSVLGAATIFLIQNLLNALSVSAFYLNLTYGGALLLAVIVGGRAASARRRSQ
jgi:ribose transport system permease protein